MFVIFKTEFKKCKYTKRWRHLANVSKDLGSVIPRAGLRPFLWKMRLKNIMVWVGHPSIIYSVIIYKNTSQPIWWSHKMMRLIGSLTFLRWQHSLEHHHITTLVFSRRHGNAHSVRAASLSNGANQTNNKSICNLEHADFLPSAIISMVYLLTERSLKAEAYRGADFLQQLSASLLEVDCLFGSHLCCPTLAPPLMQNQISDLMISSRFIIGAKPVYSAAGLRRLGK